MLHHGPVGSPLGTADDLVTRDPQVGRGLVLEAEERPEPLFLAAHDRPRLDAEA